MYLEIIKDTQMLTGAVFANYEVNVCLRVGLSGTLSSERKEEVEKQEGVHLTFLFLWPGDGHVDS